MLALRPYFYDNSHYCNTKKKFLSIMVKYVVLTLNYVDFNKKKIYTNKNFITILQFFLFIAVMIFSKKDVLIFYENNVTIKNPRSLKSRLCFLYAKYNFGVKCDLDNKFYCTHTCFSLLS